MKLSELRYSSFGEVRYQGGLTATDKRFTGQRQEAGVGLYDYGARFYSPLLGRFISPDSVVPGAADPQNFNRYSYTRNNPLRYTDPSGHCTVPVTLFGLELGTITIGSGSCPWDKPLENKCLDNCDEHEAIATMVAQQEVIIATQTAQATSQLTMTPMPTQPPDMPTPAITPSPWQTPNPNIVSSENGTSPTTATSQPTPVYGGSDKHDKGGKGQRGVRGSAMGVSREEAQVLLENGTQIGRQIYSYDDNGTIFVFKHTNNDEWHGHPANEYGDVPSAYLKRLRDEGRITNAEYKRFVDSVGGK